ncbi:MAG: capsular biosynthesis protein [Bacteroidaceae bacterium]|nr:capsular biosynthesis protein [Bacteroidaceae bacterium]
MWPFASGIRLGEGGVARGATDWHSHILPGVDDGVRTMEDSLQILAIYERLGVSELWLTPHVMEDVPNTPAGLRARFAELQAAYSGGITLRLAAEHMIDNLFVDRMESREVLPIGTEGDCLLVETSYFNPPIDLFDTLEWIQSAGFHPMLAHPERYFYMSDKDYERLTAMHVRLQLNIGSLIGLYGEHARKRARKLLRSGAYTCCGSDLHTLSCLHASLNGRISRAETDAVIRLRKT